jgi:hypothetical protein
VDNKESIGKVFISLAASLNCYRTFINSYDVANSFLLWNQKNAITHQTDMFSFPSTIEKYSAINLNVSQDTSRKLCDFIIECKMNPRHTQLNLSSYLLMPVQRIPRYKMLLESLLKQTPQTNEDHKVLTDALNIISDFIRSCNEGKRLWEAELIKLSLIFNTITISDGSINNSLIVNPPIRRKYCTSSEGVHFFLVKIVEFHSRHDPSIVSKKSSQIIKNEFKCIEYFFKPYKIKRSNESVPLYQWDIVQFEGKMIIFHLFNDILLLSKKGGNSSNLVASICLNLNTNVEILETTHNEGIMRVCDFFVVIYIRGLMKDLIHWKEMIHIYII